MSRLINRIKLFPNMSEKSKEIAEELTKRLALADFEVVTRGEFDLAIAIGGDGSFLWMMKNNVFDTSNYYIGINSGTLGFLQEISVDDMDTFIERLNNNDFTLEEIGIQETKVTTNDGNTSRFCTLNEIVVRNENLKVFKADVEIDSDLLEQYVGDGLLISTSIGSTAYNLNCGGSIVYDDLHTLQITPVAPFNTQSYRDVLNSIIIPEYRTITLKPLECSRDLNIMIDGETSIYRDVKSVETTIRDKKIKFIRMTNFSYARKINEKFLSEK